MNKFVKELKVYRHLLPRQTIKTLRGQALSGDTVGAAKGLKTVLNTANVMSMAHRQTRIILKHENGDYKGQFIISLKEAHSACKN